MGIRIVITKEEFAPAEFSDAGMVLRNGDEELVAEKLEGLAVTLRENAQRRMAFEGKSRVG